MRAQVLESFNKPYVFRPDFPKPSSPQGHDVLVRVLAASYCHTDAVFASGAMGQDLPRVGSHEFAGIVEELGPDAAAPGLGLQKGQLVGVPGRAYGCCGSCYECRENGGDKEGYGVWCATADNLGLTRDGGFEEWCRVDGRQVVPVPQGLRAVDVAPLMCAGVTIWSALQAGGVDVEEEGGGKGKTVAIIGAGGGLGHLGLQFAAKLGCDVVAVDIGGAMKMVEDVASELGAGAGKVTMVDARKEDAASAKRRVFGEPQKGREGEKGCDACLILPEAQAAFDFGMASLRNHGICVCVSFPQEGWHFQPGDLVFGHIKMVGVLVGRNRQLNAMINFAAKNGVRAKIRTYPLEALNRLVDDYHKGVGGKLVVDMEK